MVVVLPVHAGGIKVTVTFPPVRSTFVSTVAGTDPKSWSSVVVAPSVFQSRISPEPGVAVRKYRLPLSPTAWGRYGAQYPPNVSPAGNPGTLAVPAAVPSDRHRARPVPSSAVRYTTPPSAA